MPRNSKIRLRAVALSGFLGVITASSLALGVATPGSAIAAPLGLAAPLALAAPAAPAATDRARVDELSRTAERTARSRTERLAAQRSTLLTTHAKAITARNKAIAKRKAAELRRIKQLGYDPATKDPREIARQMMVNKYGWGDAQFQCYDNIIMRESRWIHTADNPNSSAYGIPQALPGSKMASAGADWRTNPATQIKWGLGYVKSRFGTPCAAWSFKKAHGWY